MTDYRKYTDYIIEQAENYYPLTVLRLLPAGNRLSVRGIKKTGDPGRTYHQRRCSVFVGTETEKMGFY